MAFWSHRVGADNYNFSFYVGLTNAPAEGLWPQATCGLLVVIIRISARYVGLILVY